jgi:hypothetical protein
MMILGFGEDVAKDVLENATLALAFDFTSSINLYREVNRLCRAIGFLIFSSRLSL